MTTLQTSVNVKRSEQRLPPPATPKTFPIRVCIDVEIVDTNSRDIDDTLMLMLLVSDPRFEVMCVTVTPGTKEQIQVVQYILNIAGKNPIPPIGADMWPSEADSCKSSKVSKEATFLGAGREVVNFQQIRDAGELLVEMCDEEATIITGASLRNLARAISLRSKNSISTKEGSTGSTFCKRWIGQGGFASDHDVPDSKYHRGVMGGTMCTSYNLSKCPVSTSVVLNAVLDGTIKEGLLVSSKRHHLPSNKWSDNWRNRMLLATKRQRKQRGFDEKFYGKGRQRALQAILDLKVRKNKALHDLLLIAVALHPNVCSWTDTVRVVSCYEGCRQTWKFWREVLLFLLRSFRRENRGRNFIQFVFRLLHSYLWEGTENQQNKQKGGLQWKTEPTGKGGVRMAYTHDGSLYKELVLPLSEGAEESLTKLCEDEEKKDDGGKASTNSGRRLKNKKKKGKSKKR